MDDEVKICPAQLLVGQDGPWRCTLPEGHKGMHEDADGEVWDIQWERPVSPETASYLRSEELPEALRDEQIRDLYRRVDPLEKHSAVSSEQIRDMIQRVETLEQTTANGAATDDMLAVLSNDMAALERRVLSALGEVEKRMTAVEGRAYAVASPQVAESLSSLRDGVATLLQRTASGVTVEHAPVMDGRCALHDEACEPCGAFNGVTLGYPCVKAKGHPDEHVDQDGDTIEP